MYKDKHILLQTFALALALLYYRVILSLSFFSSFPLSVSFSLFLSLYLPHTLIPLPPGNMFGTHVYVSIFFFVCSITCSPSLSLSFTLPFLIPSVFLSLCDLCKKNQQQQQQRTIILTRKLHQVSSLKRLLICKNVVVIENGNSFWKHYIACRKVKRWAQTKYSLSLHQQDLNRFIYSNIHTNV